ALTTVSSSLTSGGMSKLLFMRQRRGSTHPVAYLEAIGETERYSGDGGEARLRLAREDAKIPSRSILRNRRRGARPPGWPRRCSLPLAWAPRRRAPRARRRARTPASLPCPDP